MTSGSRYGPVINSASVMNLNGKKELDLPLPLLPHLFNIPIFVVKSQPVTFIALFFPFSAKEHLSVIRKKRIETLKT